MKRTNVKKADDQIGKKNDMTEHYVTLSIYINQNGEPFEMAAEKIENGKILDTFHTFVNTAMDEDISEFYGIYLEQLAGAPDVHQAVSQLEGFINGSTLIPFFAQNKRLLNKYLPNYCQCKIIEAQPLMEIYEDFTGIIDEDFNKDLKENWGELTVFLDCWKIRNDALGDATVIAKLFLWSQAQDVDDMPL